jgi:hypothetical protein
MARSGLLADWGAATWQHRLDTPTSWVVTASSWVLSSAIFCGTVALLGGPTQGDVGESLYQTWAIEHGNIACSYFPVNHATESFVFFFRPLPPLPPLWPLISGGIAAITRVGHRTTFPSQAAMGAHCSQAAPQMYHWSRDSYALFATLGLGYAGWFFLLAGVIAVIRASGRGGTGWEVLGVLLVALVPAGWATLLNYYHPQDLVAMGLILVGVACAERRRWVWAGLFVGLAVTSQQFALLALVPLFVIAPGKERWRFLVSAGIAAAAISLPFLIATSGRAIHAELLGTGDSTGFGGTVLWELHLQGAALVFASRIVPIIAAAGLAWLAVRRLGPQTMEPVPLLSLLATSLSMRLVFEKGLFPYKFMALAVMLILLAVAQRRVRGELIVWLGLLALAFNTIPVGFAINARPWGYHAASAAPLVFLVIVLGFILWDALHRRVRWYLVASFALATWAFLQWPVWSPDTLRAPFPKWFWQIILLTAGVVMAVRPLLKELRAASPMTPTASREDNDAIVEAANP